jgi:hypothetical protein
MPDAAVQTPGGGARALDARNDDPSGSSIRVRGTKTDVFFLLGIGAKTARTTARRVIPDVDCTRLLYALISFDHWISQNNLPRPAKLRVVVPKTDLDCLIGWL